MPTETTLTKDFIDIGCSYTRRPKGPTGYQRGVSAHRLLPTAYCLLPTTRGRVVKILQMLQIDVSFVTGIFEVELVLLGLCAQLHVGRRKTHRPRSGVNLWIGDGRFPPHRARIDHPEPFHDVRGVADDVASKIRP